MKKVLAFVLSLALLGASLAVTASAHRLEYIDYSRDAVASRFEIERMTYETQKQEPSCPPATVTATEDNAEMLERICGSIVGGRGRVLRGQSRVRALRRSSYR